MTKSKWISVDEMLPEPGVRVLAYTTKGEIGFTKRLPDTMSLMIDGTCYGDATHWQLVPKPPDRQVSPASKQDAAILDAIGVIVGAALVSDDRFGLLTHLSNALLDAIKRILAETEAPPERDPLVQDLIDAALVLFAHSDPAFDSDGRATHLHADGDAVRSALAALWGES